jgi:hypothetical protein
LAKLEYSQIVRRKLKKLRSELTQAYGESGSQKIMGKITKGIRRLEAFPQSGTRISSNETILILEMFHEKEDFMRKLFGIVTTSQETIDYWKERRFAEAKNRLPPERQRNSALSERSLI